MEDKYVTWKEWASSQVTIALMQEKFRGLHDRMNEVEAKIAQKKPAVMDWKWLAHMTIVVSVIAFLVLANTNEKMALAILETLRSALAR